MKQVFKHLFLILISLVSVFPFFWIVVGMTNTTEDIYQSKLTFGNAFFENLSVALNQNNLIHVLFNSLFVTLSVIVLAICVSSMAAYGFQFFGNVKTEKLYDIIIVSLMIPFTALMIPLYKQIVTVGLLDNYLAVILQATASVFLLFYFRQALKNFPLELIEAARMDGLQEYLIFFKIVVPSMKSTYAAAIIFTFMSSWNNYLWPLLVFKSDTMKTLPLAISTMSSGYSVNIGAVMIMIVISTIPALIIFFTFQKHFVAGMVGSAK